MSGVQAGKLRQTFRVEHFVSTGRGDRGQPAGAWQTLFESVHAKAETLSGKQAEVSRQLVASATHDVQVRYRTGYLPAMRLVGLSGQYAGRTLAIGHVGDGDGRRHFLTLTCTEQKTGATP